MISSSCKNISQVWVEWFLISLGLRACGCSMRECGIHQAGESVWRAFFGFFEGGLIHCKDEFIAIYPGAFHSSGMSSFFTSIKVGLCTRKNKFYNACILSICNIMIFIILCCILFGGEHSYYFGFCKKSLVVFHKSQTILRYPFHSFQVFHWNVKIW